MANASSQDGDPKNHTNVNMARNGKPYTPTPEEQAILDDWRKNSFLRGGLHGATGLLFGVWTGRMFKSMTKRTQTFIAGAMGTLGFMNGVRSYTVKSFEKLLALENSPLGDEVRRSMEGAKNQHAHEPRHGEHDHRRHPESTGLQQPASRSQLLGGRDASNTQDSDGWSTHVSALDDSSSKSHGKPHVAEDWKPKTEDVERKLRGGSRYGNSDSDSQHPSRGPALQNPSDPGGWDVTAEDVERKLRGGSRYASKVSQHPRGGNAHQTPSDSGEWDVAAEDVERTLHGGSRYGGGDWSSSALNGSEDPGSNPKGLDQKRPQARRGIDTQVVHGNGTQTGETADGDSWWGSSTVNNQKRPQSVFGGEFESDPQQQDGSATAIERRAITYDELRMRRRQQQKEQAAKED